MLTILVLGLAACHGGPVGSLTSTDAAATDFSQTDAPADGSVSPDASTLLDPASAGPSTVSTFDDTFVLQKWNGTCHVTVYVPSLVPVGGSPVVVFLHGRATSKDWYRWVGKHLASWQYVVVMVQLPDPTSLYGDEWPDAITGALDYIDAHAQMAALQNLDRSRIAVAGHSQGASAASAVAERDARVKAAVLLSPCGGSPSLVPTQIQVGSLDGICQPEKARSLYDSLMGHRQLLEFSGGNHIGFLDVGDAYAAAQVFVKADGKATMPHDDQLRLARTYLTSWLNVVLRDQQAYRFYLDGDGATADQKAEWVTNSIDW